jgi:hypothetical protein
VAAELAADLAEPVRPAISEEMEERAEPVAVEYSDDRRERMLLTCFEMELKAEDSAELMDESAELMELESAPLDEDEDDEKDEVVVTEARDDMAAGLTVVVVCYTYNWSW